MNGLETEDIDLDLDLLERVKVIRKETLCGNVNQSFLVPYLLLVESSDSKITTDAYKTSIIYTRSRSSLDLRMRELLSRSRPDSGSRLKI